MTAQRMDHLLPNDHVIFDLAMALASGKQL